MDEEKDNVNFELSIQKINEKFVSTIRHNRKIITFASQSIPEALTKAREIINSPPTC